jgi:hypothetical protein
MTSEEVIASWERECLATDPFAGDFGEVGDRTLRDKIVTSAMRQLRSGHSLRCSDFGADSSCPETKVQFWR